MAEQKTNQAVEEISVTKSDLRTIFWRSFCHEASYNAERQQALGFAFTLTKLLKKLYKDDKEAYVEACKRHTEFFNLTVQITNFVVGIVTALEEKNAKSQDKNMGPTISAVKSALMAGANRGYLFLGLFPYRGSVRGRYPGPERESAGAGAVCADV